MERCHGCGQIVPVASWSMDEFAEAFRSFRTEYLNRWAEANDRVLLEAHEENTSRDAVWWNKVLDGDPEVWGDGPEEPAPPDLRAIATSRPRVAWLCHLPRKDREWWRVIAHGPDYLARTYPEVTEEEWQRILPTKPGG